MFNDPGDNIGPKSCDLWKPVIAAVNGMACGGAFYMLGEVEFIIAAEHATFFDPHVTYGMTAAFEPIHMAGITPFPEIMRLSLLGNYERMSAQRAHQIGMVTEVVPGDRARGPRPRGRGDHRVPAEARDRRHRPRGCRCARSARFPAQAPTCLRRPPAQAGLPQVEHLRGRGSRSSDHPPSARNPNTVSRSDPIAEHDRLDVGVRDRPHTAEDRVEAGRDHDEHGPRQKLLNAYGPTCRLNSGSSNPNTIPPAKIRPQSSSRRRQRVK